ncbi:MAG: dihydroorotate dehydrogenase [Pseudorhodobacter sp.]|nr:dihydroorotate dehydrogenase [Pseudorhodobacter sp.]
MDTHELDAHFASARANPPAASPALLARVLDDALAYQPSAVNLPHPARSVAGLWSRLATALGGGGALAGLGTATLAGFYIGFAEPAPVAAISDALRQDAPLETVELFSSFDEFLMEG